MKTSGGNAYVSFLPEQQYSSREKAPPVAKVGNLMDAMDAPMAETGAAS